MKHWRLRPRRIHAEPLQPDESLVIETQSYLDGNYLEIAFNENRDVPAWAWLSVLAHGDEKSLARAATWLSDHPGVRPEFDTWGRVLEHVAHQVLDTAVAVGCSLGEIQRDLLIPLELTIINTPVGPTTLYRLISAILAELKTRVETEHS